MLRHIAKKENIEINLLKRNIVKGVVVVLANKNHKNLRPIAVDKDLTVKVNANIGTSPVEKKKKKELKKLKAAIEAGADTIMDLTVANNHADIDKIRKAIIENCPQPLGTVPIYQAAVEAGGSQNMTLKNYLRVYERHAREGVDFTTVQ